jgi:hypothetical protein
MVGQRELEHLTRDAPTDVPASQYVVELLARTVGRERAAGH